MHVAFTLDADKTSKKSFAFSFALTIAQCERTLMEYVLCRRLLATGYYILFKGKCYVWRSRAKSQRDGRRKVYHHKQ